MHATKLRHGIVPNIMNEIFRKRNMTYSTKYSYGFETRNIKTVYCISKTIAFLDPKICDPVPKNIGDSENNIFKSTLKFGN